MKWRIECELETGDRSAIPPILGAIDRAAADRGVRVVRINAGPKKRRGNLRLVRAARQGLEDS